MIERTEYLTLIKKNFKVTRIVGLLGPRQCGKTTIAKQYQNQEKLKTHYFDLENPTDLEQLQNPVLIFKHMEGLIIIDEVQRLPELFSSLRYIHDTHPNLRFLILGSASRELIHQSSESLAGRIGYIEVSPFNLTEVGHAQKLLLRGGFPSSFLAETDEESYLWRRHYVRSYLEQDIPALGFISNPALIFRFWSMLSHYHGQIFNASEIATSLMVSRSSIYNYLDILKGTFMIRVLMPWFENIKKRQIKSPKIYFRDSGLFNYFLGIETEENILKSPKLGALWEGFALENILTHLQVEANECYFWGTHNQAELDLLVFQKGKRLGFEFKYTDTPRLTKSINIAFQDLKLDMVTIIYPGEKSYQISDKIFVTGLEAFMPLKP